MRNYYSLNEYCRSTFGHKLYKIALEGGMTCPNRDGTISTRGCIFCSEKGSGEFAQKLTGSITEQIEKAKLRVSHKNRDGKYIAYFQSFTNTYAPTNYLEKIFTEAISHRDVEVLSVATRPDCINPENAALLSSLNKIKPVWVELGFQTSNEKTAVYINRGYKNEVFDSAVKLLKNENINTVAHIILGLPGETSEDMENSVRYVCSRGIWGIKLHMLYVLKGTELEKDYLKGSFTCFSQEEYLNTICRLIKIIPENVVIHRLTGDGDKKLLIAPLWSGNKKAVLNSLNKKITGEGIFQGSEA